eukprot:1039491-Prorocentrum_lima.AAC.1
MVPTLQPRNLAMPPMPEMTTPPRTSTPGASSHVQGRLGFSPHQLHRLHKGLREKPMGGIQQ